MSNKSEMTIGLNIVAEIGQFQNQMKVVQSELSKLGASNSLKESFEGAYKQIQEEIKKIQNLTQGEKISVADEKTVAKSFDTIKRLWKSTVSQMDSEKMKGTLLKEDQQAIDVILSKLKTYNSDVRKINNARSSGLQTLKQEKDTAKSNLEIAKQELKQLNDTKKSLNDQLKSAQDKVSAAKASREAADAEVKAAKTLAETTKEQFKEQYTKDHNDSSRGWNLEWEKIVRAAGAQEDFTEKTKRAAEALEQEKAAQKEVDDIQSKIDTNSTKIEDSTKNVKDLSQAHEDAKKALDAYKDATTNLKTDQFEELKRTLFDIEKTKINWADFGVKPEDIKNTADLQKVMQDIADKGGPRAQETLDKFNAAISNASRASEEASGKFNNVRQSLSNMTSVQSDVDRLTGRLVRFFSMDNAVRLFRRAIRSAMQTVKELDAVMTQTAVVTQYSIADMWKQLPEYTQRANELGLAVKDVYEASTLYYQQGLSTNEVVALTNATLRMARIAGLEAADATDRMTNALRGFNMELDEANADNVADVYSKLAAMSASNVDEISTAMTKVASLAHSANMEFENTAAFLAQIIETTRESAETAGTALKTVVARFSEVKNLYSKGELLGTDEEGEEIDVNKVSKALRTAGINLNEFLVGQKGLDDIFIELAKKWDDLDIVQQRYIATMAAGSRQQSRFIALMSDYKRTVELTTAANDASGASLSQYEKTLESIETKTNRLKNAWNEFLMGIANDEAIRRVLDALTNFLNGLNNFTSFVTGKNGLLKSVANISLVLGGLKLGKNLLTGLLGDPIRQIPGWIGKFKMTMKAQNAAMVGMGTQAGLGFKTGFEKTAFSGIKNAFARTFKNRVTATQLGLEIIDFRDVNVMNQLGDPAQFEKAFRASFSNIDTSVLNADQSSLYTKISKEMEAGGTAFQDYNNQLKASGVQMQLTSKQADALGLTFENQTLALNKTRMACLGIGIALTALGGLIEKVEGKSTAFSKAVKAAGIALMGVSALLPLINAAVDIFVKKFNLSISSIPIVGWITAIITLITSLITFLISAGQATEQAVKDAKESVDTLTSEIQETTDSISKLNDSIEQLGEHQKTLENLARGTESWNKEVAENNKLVLELMNNYKGLKIINEGGLLKITNLSDVLDEYNSQLEAQQLNLAGANYKLALAQLNKAISDTKINFSYVTQTGDRQGAQINEPLLKAILKDLEQVDILNDEAIEKAFKDRMKKSFDELEFDGDLGNIVRETILKLDPLKEEVNNAAIALGPYIQSITDAETASSKFADVFINNTDKLSSAIEEKLKELNTKKLGQEDTETQTAYKQWVTETYGKNAAGTIDDRTGNFYVNGNEHKYNNDATKSAFAAWRAAQGLAKEMQTYVQALENLETSKDKTSQAIATALSATEGKNLTKDVLDQILDWSQVDLTKNERQLKESEGFGGQLRQQWENDENLQAAYETADAYVNVMYDVLIPAADTFYTKLAEGIGPAIGALNLDAELSKALYTQFTNAFQGFEDYGESLFPSDLEKLGIQAKDTEKFYEALSKLDFRSKEDLDEFGTQLSELGIIFDRSKLDTWLDNIASAAEALVSIDVKKFIDQSKDAAKVISEIRSGKQGRTFSEDTYNKLIELDPELTKQFTYREDGSYLYLGTKLDEIVEAINIQTEKLTGTTEEQVEARARAYDVAQGIKVDDFVVIGGTTQGNRQRAATQEEKDKDYLTQIIEAYGEDVGKLGINGLFGKTKVDQLGADTAARMVKEFQDMAANPDLYKEQLNSINDNRALTEQMQNTPQLIAAQYGTSKDENVTEAQRKALLSKMSMIVPEDVVNLFNNSDWDQAMAQRVANLTDTYSSAETWGVESEQLQAMAEQYMDTYGIAIDQASQAALENINLNTGLEAITNSYDDWSALLKKGQEDKTLQSTKQYQETIAELEKNIKQMFSIQGDLSSSFMNSAETAQLLEAAATGDTDAIEKLRVAAAKDISLSFNLDEDNEAKFNTLQDQLIDYINAQDPTIDIRTELDDASVDSMINFFNKMLQDGKITAEQMQDYFSAIGFVPETKWEKKQITTHMWGNYPVLSKDGTKVTTIPYEYDQISEVAVPQITDLRYNGPDSSMKVISPSIGDTAKKNKEGKGGKESKKKDWKNPYDELYNLQEHINSALREREKLEANYQRMLENHRTTGEELQKQSMKEIASLQKQLYYQKQMMAGRKKQMTNVLNETYEDSEGNRKTYGSMGLQKYAWYEEDTQTVHIEWDKINQVTDEDQGKAIEAYVSRLEELRDQMQDVEDAIDEANDQIREIQMRNTEEYINFEQRVYDALVNQYQKEIDMLGEVNQSITDATNKTLDAISEEIEKERQARENEKAREELSDKEARLAYLQRDTSGMNALEIQKLQQELENERQSYQDSIVDQTLQEMRDEAARAEAQRQAQIDMMQGQLDWWQEVGYPLWERVETLIDGGVDETGKLVETSELAALLKDSDNIKAISEIQAFKWRQDLAKEVAAQFEGFANWKMEMARDAGEVTIGKNKYTYHPESNTWTGPDGKEYNVYYRNGQYVAEKVQKPKEVSVGSGAQQPGGTQTSPSTQPKTPPSGPPQTPPIETTLSDNDKKAFAALYLAGYYNQESLANEIGKNNAGQSISYGHGNNYLYDLFTQAVGGNTKWQSNSSWKKYIKGNTTWKKYAQGGLADFTGPAWLDGTKSHPEMVLNATDTQNLITLKNILGAILQNANSASKTSTGDNYFDINIDAQISSDYDVDQLSERIKKQIYEDSTYRNVNTIHYIR